jgi:hypothetical protein
MGFPSSDAPGVTRTLVHDSTNGMFRVINVVIRIDNRKKGSVVGEGEDDSIMLNL